MIKIICFAAAALLALAGCAPMAPAPAVSVINSLSFDNAVSGKRDGLRSAWPAGSLARTAENFPMGQVKQCDAAGANCQWGVLKARRSFGKVDLVPGGVAVDVEVAVDIARSHSAMTGTDQAAVAIPADVGTLQAHTVQKRSQVLEYGKVARIAFLYGITYELCAFRLDAARQPIDNCEIGYF